KESHFVAIASQIAPLHTKGPVKTAAHCTTKWQTVSFVFVPMVTDKLIRIFQLKKQFVATHRFMSTSGGGSSYNPATGFQATTPSERSVIKDFTAKNPVCYMS